MMKKLMLVFCLLMVSMSANANVNESPHVHIRVEPMAADMPEIAPVSVQQWAGILGIQPGQKKGFGKLFNSFDVGTTSHSYKTYVTNHALQNPRYSYAVWDRWLGGIYQAFYTPVGSQAEAEQLCGLMGAKLMGIPGVSAGNTMKGQYWNKLIAPMAEKSIAPGLESRAFALDVFHTLDNTANITSVAPPYYAFPHQLTGWGSYFSSADTLVTPCPASGSCFVTEFISLDKKLLTANWGSYYGKKARGCYVQIPNNRTYDGVELTNRIYFKKEDNAPFMPSPTYPICEWFYTNIDPWPLL